VADGRMGGAAMARYFLARRIELVGAAGADGDRRSRRGEFESDGAADTAAGAGDDDAPPLEVEGHAVSLSLMATEEAADCRATDCRATVPFASSNRDCRSSSPWRSPPSSARDPSDRPRPAD